ncbi:MAG: PhoH family protein [Thiovulaceae bacterium]|nr:PhoH family protein [Sulfurimonadaceae bacterium]
MIHPMYEKYFLLDTNILLEDASNLFTLSQDGKNLIILAETVLDEIDSKKSGFDEINFQAREFARILEDAQVIKTVHEKSFSIVTLEIKRNHQELQLDIVSKEFYDCDKQKMALSILNDRKILEVGATVADFYPQPITFISSDIMARTRALSLGLETSGLKGSNSPSFNFEYVRKVNIPFSTLEDLPNAEIERFDPHHKAHYFCYEFKVIDSDQVILASVQNGKIHILEEEELRDQHVTPLNKQQLFLSYAIAQNYFNMVIVEALAGSGKTLLALSGAIKLVRQKMQRHIIYIRNSIESVDKGEEVGFLPGLEEKFRIYNHPLMDSLEYMVRANHKKKKNQGNLGQTKNQLDEQEVQTKVEEMISRFAIETMWVGEMRGRTLSDAVVIIDEAQNMSNKTMQMVLSRIDATSKVIILGSNKQIDNFYLNAHTNALTTLLHASEHDHEELNLFALKLTKVLRGPITAWAEKIFSSK